MAPEGSSRRGPAIFHACGIARPDNHLAKLLGLRKQAILLQAPTDNNQENDDGTLLRNRLAFKQ